MDLIARLDPLMHELESYTEPLLVVSHQATLRMVYAYLMGKPRKTAPKAEIPLPVSYTHLTLPTILLV